ncbi:MAG: helix-turn-helix domain-containing protein [Candidatus Micrarchaeota archaeon]
MDVKNIIETLELTKSEATVYAALSEKKHSTGGELIKTTGMYRAAVYDILHRLIEKGIVGYTQIGNCREFSITPLSLVRQELESEIESIKEKQKELEKIEKQAKTTSNTTEPEVFILKGNKGVKTLFAHLLETGVEWHIFGAQGQFKQMFPEYYQLIHAKRVKHGVGIKIIYNSRVRVEHREKELPLISTRYVEAKFDTPATTIVYGDYVAIIIWSKPQFVTWIKSKDVAKSYEHQFQMLWKHAKQ